MIIFKRNSRPAFIVTMFVLLTLSFAFLAPHLALAQVGALNANPDSCSGGWLSTSTLSPQCWIRPIFVTVGGSLLYVAGRVLAVSGMLFNTLVDYTIINFGGALYGEAVRSAVQTAWQAFRDLANIVIIGMFVFFSISIILGIQQFNEKKNIARVLIVAILINFSLLFTEIIIDFSNFTAYQIYNAAGLQANAAAGQSVGQNAASKNNDRGFSGAFLELLGIGGYTDTIQTVKNTAAANDSGWIALLHSIFGFMFIIAAAIVLFYGSFLLISRALLLIFLLLTSSIAFATYLIPVKYAPKFGWNMWKDSLLRSAIFAPILMVMLWVTLVVGSAMQHTVGVGDGSLGALESDPTKVSNIAALLMYLLMLFLLFITFKVSSSFSSSIAGFDWASALPLAGLAAASGIFAKGLRGTLGAGAYYAGSWAQDRSVNKDGKDRGLLARSLYKYGADSLMKAAKSDLNPLRAGGNALARTAGMKNIEGMIGKKGGGYEAELKAKAERQLALKSDAEKAKDLANDKLKEEAKRREAEAARTGQAAQGDRIIKAAKDSAKTEGDMLKEALKSSPQDADRYAAKERTKGEADEMLGKLVREQHAQTEVFKKGMAGLKEQKSMTLARLSSNKNDEVAKSRLQEIDSKIKNAKADHAAMFKESKQRINDAKVKAHEVAKELEKMQQEITAKYKEQSKAASVGTAAMKKASAATQDFAAKAATNRLGPVNIVRQAFGKEAKPNTNLERMIRKVSGDKAKKEKFDAVLKAGGFMDDKGRLTDSGRSLAGAETPPPAPPPAPPPTPPQK